MNVVALPETQAFKEGAELWLLSDSDHSPWHYKLDWYLGFLMTKSRSLKLPDVSKKKLNSFEKAHSIPKDTLTGLSNLNITKSLNSPLLIESSSYLPNLWTIELVYNKEWLTQVKDIWYRLNEPKMRIFLPQDIKEEALVETWKNIEDKNLIQYLK